MTISVHLEGLQSMGSKESDTAEHLNTEGEFKSLRALTQT